MHSALDQDAVLKSIATILAQAGGFEATAIYILDPDTQLLHPAAIVGVESNDAARMRATPVKLSEYAHLMQPSMRVSRSYLFDHRRHDMPEGSLLDRALSVPEFPPDWRPGQWHPLDSLTIPLELARGQLLGLISLDCPRDRRYPDLATVRALELFSDQCAAAISRTQLYQNMEQLALTDSLTGLNNRHALEQTLSQDLLRIARDRQPYSVLFCDLDKFKDVNDHRGHAVGDQILQQVAAVFRQRLRWLDFAARCGGDEFVILLRDTGTEQAVRVAEDIRRRIAAAPTPCRITASIGVASPAPGNLDAAGLIGAADAAMYEAKRSGRDQVSVASRDALAGLAVSAQPA
jgi:diguanylate cyclase (GGDEF)-like protein